MNLPKHPTNELTENEIELLHALLTPFEELRQKRGDKPHLGGMCVMVSEVAARILTEKKFRQTTWHHQRGRYGTNLPQTGPFLPGHSWLVSGCGNFMLDLTADQYGEERIYFGRPTAQYVKVPDDFSEILDTGFYDPAKAAYEACLRCQQSDCA